MKTRKSWREKLADDKGLPKVVIIGEKMRKQLGTGTVAIPAPRELAFLGELAEQPIERSVELRCRARQPVAAGERKGEDISLHRTWRDLLHLDSHGRAMLADAPRTLRSACRGYTFAAFAPIEETWLAAHLFDACAQPDFGAAGTALRSSR